MKTSLGKFKCLLQFKKNYKSILVIQTLTHFSLLECLPVDRV